jgi:hypothetical protein
LTDFCGELSRLPGDGVELLHDLFISSVTRFAEKFEIFAVMISDAAMRAR